MKPIFELFLFIAMGYFILWLLAYDTDKEYCEAQGMKHYETQWNLDGYCKDGHVVKPTWFVDEYINR